MDDRTRGDRIQKKVSLVVQLVDGFTDRPITGSNARVQVEQGLPPIQKKEGYYVFVNLQMEEANLKVESPSFCSQTRKIRLLELDHNFPFLKIRMQPDQTYPIPAGSTCVCGKAEKHSDLQLMCRSKGSQYKLLIEYEKQKNPYLIAIYNPKEQDLDGRLFLIENKEGTSSEYFTVVHTAKGEERYSLMDRPLQHSYKKIGASVYPVYSARTDARGNFFFLLPASESGGKDYCIRMAEDHSAEFPIEIKAGVRNEVDIRNLRKG